MFGQPKFRMTVLAVCVGALSTIATGQGWQPEAPLRVALDMLRACADSRGNIYVLGGAEHLGPPTTRVEMLEFDRTNGGNYVSTWVDVASMTTPRLAPAVVCAGDFIYAIGGSGPSGNLASVERFDTQNPASGWQLLPSSQWLTTPRSNAAAAVDHAGRIYVIGGNGVPGAGGWLDTVEVYDPGRPANGWTVLQATLSTGRVAHGAVTAPDGRIWAIGGEGASVHLDSVEIYDPCNPTSGWQPGPSITGPNSNNDPATLGADGNIYVAGGWLPGITDRAVRYSFRDGRWQEIYSLTHDRSRAAMVLGKNGRVFAIGGGSAGGPFPYVESLNTVPCYADGDISTGMRVLDIFDFLYFQNAFVAGCP